MKVKKDIEHPLDEILLILNKFPDGANIEEIRIAYHQEVSLRTLQRRLAKLAKQQAIIVKPARDAGQQLAA